MKKESGLSAIEIIAVLLIVGVISALVVSKTSDMGADVTGAREVIKNHIRYAQIMAMTSNTVCGVQFSGAVYSIFKNGSLAEKIKLPNSPSSDFSIPAGMSGTNETIYFDFWGTPYSDLALTAQRPTGLIGNLGITMQTYTGYVK